MIKKVLTAFELKLDEIWWSLINVIRYFFRFKNVLRRVNQLKTGLYILSLKNAAINERCTQARWRCVAAVPKNLNTISVNFVLNSEFMFHVDHVYLDDESMIQYKWDNGFLWSVTLHSEIGERMVVWKT